MFLANCIGEGPWLTACANVCIPAEVARLTTLIYNAIKVVVPLALIITGMFTMAKAITQKSEDEIKKSQQLLVKRAVAAAIVFVLFSLITWMLTILSSTGTSDSQSVIDCMNALFNKNAETGTIQGKTQGVTNVSSECKKFGYDGALKLYSSDGSSYEYVCYNYNRYDSRCGESGPENGVKYKLSDGTDYCVIILTEENSENPPKATLAGSRTFNHSCSDSNENGCKACCIGLGYREGIFSIDGKCTCAKK